MRGDWLTFGLSSEQEARFRRATLDADLAHTRTCILITIAVMLPFTVNDYGFFGLNPIFYALLAARGVLLLYTLAVFRWLRGITDYRDYDRGEFRWGLAVALFTVLIAATRPQTFTAHAIVSILAVFVTMLAIPNRFSNQLLVSLAFAGGEALVIIPNLATSPQATTTALLSLLLASAVAVATGHQLQAWRRREFLAHEEARSLARFPEENPNLVLRVTPDGRILYRNAVAARLAGWQCETGTPLPEPLRDLLCRAMAGNHSLQEEVALGDTVFSVAVVPIPGEGYANIYGQDISEQIRFRAEMRESEKKFATIFHSTSIAMALALFPEGAMYDVNEAWLRLTGFSSKEEIIGKTSLELGLIPDPERRERIIAEFGRVGAVHTVEMTIRTRAGDRRTLLVDLQKVEIDGLPYVLSTHVDISERKNMEENLRQAQEGLELRIRERTEDLYQANASLVRELAERQRAERELRASYEEIHDLYNHAPCGYHSLDTEGAIVQINDTELHWLGYAREEVINQKRFVDLLTAASTTAFAENFPAFKERGWLKDLELVLVRKDGTTLTVLVNATAIYDEHHNFVMSRSTLFDISALKKSELAMTATEERYRTLFEGIPDAILIADLDTGVIVDANPSATRLLGRSCIELVGRHQSALHPPRLAARTKASFAEHAQAARSGKIVTPFEHTILRADGTEVPVEIVTQPITLGGTKMLQGVFRDVSERKKAEEELRQLNDQLEQRVAERTTELERKNRELERLNRLFVGRELRMRELKVQIAQMGGQGTGEEEES